MHLYRPVAKGPCSTYIAGLVLSTLLGLGVSALLVQAADPFTAAKVISAEGQVSVFRSGELWALFAGNTVRVGETIVTGPQGSAKLEISDGSYFEVYPGSRVVFRSNPNNLRELAEVFLGKIKVYIQTFGGRPNPYRVHSPTAVISVRGTVFEVEVDSDNVTSVAVDEGVVVVEHRLLPGKAVPLQPGESLRIFPNAEIAQSGISKAGVAARVARMAEEALYTLRGVGVGPGTTKVPGGVPAPGSPPPTGPSPPPLPGDRKAPPPPPPPAPKH